MDELTFEESKARLEEIANLVEDPAISLDEALALYEEAVKIGLHACDVSEQDILVDETDDEVHCSAEQPGDEPSSAAESSASEQGALAGGATDVQGEDGQA